LLMVKASSVQPGIFFNKIDLLDTSATNPVEYYRRTGFPLLTTSTKTGMGLLEFRNMLASKTSVLAGPSGVGKSSLLNKVEGLSLKTGEISEKTAQIPDYQMELKEVNMEVIKKAIQQLPDGYRVVLSLFLIEGYDHEEISEILGISNSNSRTQYLRAKNKLRELLKDKEIYSYN